ncbi:hypothetical protein ASA1KI_41060 [Opitutales bacterium ASA1]|uniref:NADH-quinone oxidoreductase subunit C n=1 Tax=Congregicoccus parvus TaxID=3081749 RepID=UPI002B2BD26C|nr:hypothetical protein ASA1KI_41060 [Opitutales bacterium ASA1]
MSSDAVDAIAGRLREMNTPSSEDATVSIAEHSARGWNLDATVVPERLVEAARMLDAEGFGIDAVTGVDWIAAGQMEIVYDFFHPMRAVRAVLRTRVPRARPEVPTIQDVFPGANWHERETHDFFGIHFVGHPDLTPLLLPEDADFHPLRKDYPGAS